MKILVPVDGSIEAERGLDYAISLARVCGASLGVIHVVQLPPVWPVFSAWRIPTPVSYNTVHDEHQTYRRRIETIETNGSGILARAEAKVKAAGLKVEKILESGRPADRIVKVACEEGYDLIVIGRRGNSGIREVFMRSVSYRVSQYAKCPVLLAR